MSLGLFILLLFFFLLILILFLSGLLCGFTLSLLLLFFGLLGIIEHLLLSFLHRLICLLQEGLSLLDAVRDDKVVEDGSRLHLPEVESNSSEILVLVDGVIISVFRVRNHRMNPWALVVRVLDPLCLPRTLELRVVDHWGFVLAIGLVIPILWLLGLGVNDLCRNIIVALRFHVLWVVHHILINPVLWFALVRILDFLGWEEIPIIGEAASRLLLAVNLDNVSLVWLHNESVYMGELVVLALDIFLNQMLLALVSENNVNLLGAVSTDIRTEHDGILLFGFLIKGSTIETRRENLDVSASAVDFLRVLDGELDDKVFAGVVENLIEVRSQGVELGVLASLEALVLLFVAVPISGSELPLSVEFVDGRLCPLRHIIESILEIGFARHGERQRQRDKREAHGSVLTVSEAQVDVCSP
mmetsp:Transcript_16712/g.33787  ORF Transcript_16712/g.33787 Transcript_16712/m.33787 type:complete len:415 (+) Transcript_16712:148-1392(+)